MASKFFDYMRKAKQIAPASSFTRNDAVLWLVAIISCLAYVIWKKVY